MELVPLTNFAVVCESESARIDPKGRGGPRQHQPWPRQTPLTRKQRTTHEAHGPASDGAPAHFMWGRLADCPGPIRTTLQDNPRSTSHSRGRPSTTPHAYTNNATGASPTAKQTTMIRRTLQREDRVNVQGPVRKPTKDQMFGGGGGLL